MKIAVVILNWNGKKHLAEFLPSVVSFSKQADIYVADNGSTDDSVTFLRQHYPEVKIIPLDKNYGFAGGYNHALKQIEADYYVLLNSDVEVTPGWIDPVVTLMEKDTSIGACQPKMLSYRNREYFEYAGAAGGYIDHLGFPFCRGRIFSTIEKDKGQYDDCRSIFWASGACMFVRSKSFYKAGGFDEIFFAHMEEIDLCWRMQHHENKIVVCPASIVYHLGGGTLDKSNPFKTYLNFRNNLLLLYKNLPARDFRQLFLKRLILDMMASVKFLFGQGGMKEMASVFRAYKDFFSIKKLRDRELVKSNNIEKQPATLIMQKSVVISYYLKGNKTFTKLGFTK